MDIFEKVKEQTNIADVVESFGVQLNNKDKGLCPFHNEKTPSFSVDRKSNIFKCFGCGETGDAIAFVSKIKNIEPLNAAKCLADMYRIDLGDCPNRVSIKDYLKACIRDVDKTDYFAKRGIAAATVKKYCLGYDVKRNAIVLPYSSELRYYQTRSIIDKKFFKPTTDEAGAEPLFNRNALWGASKEPVFIVESPLCALSVMQCGSPAVSLCGVGGTNKLVKEVKDKKPNAPLVLCLDNDEPGKKASKSLADELSKLKVPYIVYNIAGEKKDPNELLMEDAKALASNVQLAKKEVKRIYKRGVGSIVASDLITAEFDPPEWLIPDVLPQGLAILCASSKVGKSWMAMQMCLAVSRGKEFLDYVTNQAGCLYLALEDGVYRLQDRLKKLLCKEKSPDNFYLSVKADVLDGGLIKQLDEEFEEHPDIKLIIIDTLQKVRGSVKRNEIAYATDYRELGTLKEYADKRKVCIFLIHHLRKMADENDVFNMISGSNGIMGVCDTIYIIYKKKRQDENATMFMTGRDIKQQDIVVHFNESKYRWEMVGSAEDEERKRKKREYENNPLVITVKQILKNPPYAWKGTASEMLKAIYDVTGQPCPMDTRALGKAITDVKTQLYYDGIEHNMKRNGQSRTHYFSKRQKYMQYAQGSFLEDQSDDE
ncbi:MAG: AAA family ATPase [Clostridia bacterium]|nr:AAA family ATPase [Clostridia bacterium]